MITSHSVLKSSKFKTYLRQFKSREKVPLTCPQCLKEYKKLKHEIQYTISDQKNMYCSSLCSQISQTQKITNFCGQCGNVISKQPSQIKKSKSLKLFCNKSCAATYNNQHKTTGTRRSKFEFYVENQIKNTWPNLFCLFNYKSENLSELDIYIPDLHLAFELNGIFHYEPIYGMEKLSKTQINDLRKFATCQNMGIELCVIDITACNNKNQEKYWNIIKDLIISIITRNHGGPPP